MGNFYAGEKKIPGVKEKKKASGTVPKSGLSLELVHKVLKTRTALGLADYFTGIMVQNGFAVGINELLYISVLN